MGKGVMQGNPEYPIIFIIMVDAAVWSVFAEVLGTQEYHHTLSCVLGESNLSLYDYDRQISGRDPDWVQDAMSVAVEIFCRVGM